MNNSINTSLSTNNEYKHNEIKGNIMHHLQLMMVSVVVFMMILLVLLKMLMLMILLLQL